MPTSTGSSGKIIRVEQLDQDEFQRRLGMCPKQSGQRVRIGLSMFDIYPIAEVGELRAQDGSSVEVASGDLVKILDNPSDAEWCYRVVHLAVHMPGGFTADLKEETYVAVLQRGFAERIKRGCNGRDDVAGSPEGGSERSG